MVLNLILSVSGALSAFEMPYVVTGGTFGTSTYFVVMNKLAWTLFRLIEEKCTDRDGYLEAFDRDFTPVSNEKLSENGVLAERTMNTLLHVFEGYPENFQDNHQALTYLDGSLPPENAMDWENMTRPYLDWPGNGDVETVNLQPERLWFARRIQTSEKDEQAFACEQILWGALFPDL